ncbi:MAG TPA: hypothetical protein VK627_01805, partial [Edaphobacter sp.]|nr:hypothetical protein [Edaphobacter sp.]
FAVLIWPVTLLVCVLSQRQRISRILSALTLLAESANKIKIWQVEVEKTVENSIDHEVEKAAAQAQPHRTPEIPKNETLAAARVDTLITSVLNQPARDNLTESIRQKMLALAQEYETTRDNMPSGKDRTGAMNAVVARMRTLAIAAKPFLKEFSENRASPGTRLCAIVILQISPDQRYIEWLGQRYSQEVPFIFYQTAVALMQAVRDIGTQNRQQLHRVITKAITVVESFREGVPDRNTLNVLKSALNAVEDTGYGE